MRKVKVLIGVDLQNDFVSGALGTQEARNIIPKVKAKVASAVNEGDIVVFTRDTHGENYLKPQKASTYSKHCEENTWGWKSLKVSSLRAMEPKIIDTDLRFTGFEFIRELIQELASRH